MLVKGATGNIVFPKCIVSSSFFHTKYFVIPYYIDVVSLSYFYLKKNLKYLAEI